MVIRRIAGVLALAFGLVGVMACAAGVYGVRRVQVRLDRANDAAFDTVDNGLSAVQERVPLVRERVQQSKITTEDVGAIVRRWATIETRERVVTALEIESRAATLASHLEAADARLDASTIGISSIRRVLELTDVLDADANATATGQALDAIAALRDKLREAQRLVGEVQQFASGGGGPIESSLAQITKVLARIVLTLSDADGRLDDFAVRLTEIRSDARQRQERRTHQILIGALAACAILVWIAAAQMALCSWGWSRART